MMKEILQRAYELRKELVLLQIELDRELYGKEIIINGGVFDINQVAKIENIDLIGEGIVEVECISSIDNDEWYDCFAIEDIFKEQVKVEFKY